MPSESQKDAHACVHAYAHPRRRHANAYALFHALLTVRALTISVPRIGRVRTTGVLSHRLPVTYPFRYLFGYPTLPTALPTEPTTDLLHRCYKTLTWLTDHACVGFAYRIFNKEILRILPDCVRIVQRGLIFGARAEIEALFFSHLKDLS
jgi:hypothetical protein